MIYEKRMRQVPLSIRISDDLSERIDQLAERLKLGRSELVRRLLTTAVGQTT